MMQATKQAPVSRLRLDESWRERAACTGYDLELFFPIGTVGAGLEQAERAKSICRRCDVVDQCLEWAMRTNQDAGVWGGLSEDERRALRRSRRRQGARAAWRSVTASG